LYSAFRSEVTEALDAAQLDSVSLNRWVFKWRLKVRMFSHSRTTAGREFQLDGASTEKAQRASSVCMRGMTSVGASEERRARGGAWVCTSSPRYAGVAVVRALFTADYQRSSGTVGQASEKIFTACSRHVDIHCISPAPRNWRRRPGRPRHTWLRTVEKDLRQFNLGLASGLRRAQNRTACRTLTGTVTSPTSSD